VKGYSIEVANELLELREFCCNVSTLLYPAHYHLIKNANRDNSDIDLINLRQHRHRTTVPMSSLLLKPSASSWIEETPGFREQFRKLL
jgi:hypothetical protein